MISPSGLSPLLGVLLIACQAGADGGEDRASSLDSAPHADMPVSPSDSLQLRVEVSDRVAAGAPVPITLHVRNTTDRTLELHLRGRTIAFDLVVEDDDGAVVWRKLEGEVVPAILRLETLAPGAALELEHVWPQRSNAGRVVRPGEYRVRGEVLTDGEPLVAPAVGLRIAAAGS